MASAPVAEAIPDHVPPTAVWNQSFDAFTAEGDDPWLAVTRMHDGPGIVWTPDASYGRPGWVLIPAMSPGHSEIMSPGVPT